MRTWQEIEEACKSCRQCRLCENRHHVVFGVGQPKARVMFIGEGPGEQEDLQGEPFVGRAGQLLDKMLFAVDLDRRKNIYITNIVKCRPPHNRDPQEDEQNCCIGYLREQTRLIRPRIIVTLGRIAGMKLIKPDLRITREHGSIIERKGILMMPMLHPAALLRNQSQMEGAFRDFLILREKIKEVCPETYEN
ncbi:uracil-DNA glycosylase family protein [Ruminococcus sp.]|uniref:uracil-DNA glycosylase n=1 Tax=Ruminococcus sp. TaxID=41978 RepID=UPI00388ED790